MPRTRNRLIVAARRSMLQRAELYRRLDVARAAFKPGALVDRGKYRIGEVVDDTAHAVQEQFRSNRLPIAIAAAAGVAWLLREPIKEHAPRLVQKIQDLAADVADHFRSTDDPADEDEIETLEEEDNEAVR
ncbi:MULTISPECIES: hypothetical protein [unclassified Sphingopyxis]|jgi:hypothetical protein|uniref:hypothetical protein n=1 Tax=unclassified Sphingopyxis TaxID=2614943 RepID=UPI0006C06689|nr:MULTISPECIES: hypothetical protein [unclassified Sphingopyxis]USI78477.1 hypothetical protein KEC45_06140 [Sphingopyxis sp. USTB-05]GAO79113.1 hypothetical protein SC1_02432 [Sphingopyxis sp. C-1]